MCCFNRREKTLRCLRSLSEQEGGVKLEIFLLDDCSVDGTADAVREVFPETNVLEGSGSLFWGGGMHRASSEANKRKFDFMLWLNDDVALHADALQTLIQAYQALPQEKQKLSVVVGAVCDSVSGKLSYSGFARESYWNPLKLRIVEPDPDASKECDTMNGNCVLIPRAVVDEVGIVDPVFVHQLGDLDYGYRVRKAGGRIIIANKFVGTCSRNPGPVIWKCTKLSRVARLRSLISPHGLPILPWLCFFRRHSSFLFALIFLPSIYIKNGLSALFSGPASR